MIANLVRQIYEKYKNSARRLESVCVAAVKAEYYVRENSELARSYCLFSERALYY